MHAKCSSTGGSFLKQIHPEIVATDITTGRVDLVCDARELPLPAGSVRALFLAHVYHHIPDIRLFLNEARRVLTPGGVISIIDCAHTPFGRFFFSAIHPEPYDSRTRDWSFPEGDSLLDSNQALTWITLTRDRAQFLAEFPEFEIEGPELLPWFSYLGSGGDSRRNSGAGLQRRRVSCANVCDGHGAAPRERCTKGDVSAKGRAWRAASASLWRD